MTEQGPTEVTIDSDLCAASAMCQMIAPKLFSMPDDADWATVLKSPISDPAELALVEEATTACPTQAILLRLLERGAG
jgi:ferredoxin